jgi:hypothetical protein
MNLSEIRRYIQARTGESSEATIIAELNLCALEHWTETDPAGSVKEVYVRAGQNNLATLPPYVWAIKAIASGNGLAVSLCTPRPAYNTETAFKDPYTWSKVGSSPLYRSLAGAGRITARCAVPNAVPFTVSLAGPDSVANHTVDTLSLGANDLHQQGRKSFSDIVNASKSGVTVADVNLFDVEDNLVGTILANQTRADCQVIRVIDPHFTATTTNPAVYRVLYKEPPLSFQVGVETSVDDTLGLALANKVCSELLGRSSEAADQGRARAYEARAGRIVANQQVQRNENTTQPVQLRANPISNLYSGRL